MSRGLARNPGAVFHKIFDDMIYHGTIPLLLALDQVWVVVAERGVVQHVPIYGSRSLMQSYTVL